MRGVVNVCDNVGQRINPVVGIMSLEVLADAFAELAMEVIGPRQALVGIRLCAL